MSESESGSTASYVTWTVYGTAEAIIIEADGERVAEVRPEDGAEDNDVLVRVGGADDHIVSWWGAFDGQWTTEVTFDGDDPHGATLSFGRNEHGLTLTVQAPAAWSASHGGWDEDEDEADVDLGIN